MEDNDNIKSIYLNSANIMALVGMLGKKGIIEIDKFETLKNEHYKRLTNDLE
jgi:hypothetical protein